jgi:hypothetical protein
MGAIGKKQLKISKTGLILGVFTIYQGLITKST